MRMNLIVPALAVAVGALAGCDTGGGLLGGRDKGPWDDLPESMFSDATYTVRLIQVNDAEPSVRGARLERYREIYVRNMKWSNTDLFIHDDGASAGLYYGRYGTEQAARDKLAELHKVRNPQTGNSVFGAAVAVATPGADFGPPEWDIRNAPANAYWTLVVGEWFDIPEKGFNKRRKAAVWDCKRLRERWNKDIYYYHGPGVSYVMVGAFPYDAVKMVKVADGSLSPQATDPELLGLFSLEDTQLDLSKIEDEEEREVRRFPFRFLRINGWTRMSILAAKNPNRSWEMGAMGAKKRDVSYMEAIPERTAPLKGAEVNPDGTEQGMYTSDLPRPW